MPDPLRRFAAAIPANARSRAISQPLRPHAGKAPDLRHRSRLPKDRRSRRLRARRSEGVGRPRHQDLNQRSRRRHRTARQAACALPLCGKRAALIHVGLQIAAQGRRRSERDQLDLFRALPGDLAARDAQDLMAYPFFSLAKSKRIVPIDFRAGKIAHSCRSRARTWHGDHLGCGCPDLGGLADRRGPRRRFEDIAADGRDAIRNPDLRRPRHQRARLRPPQGRARPAAIDDRA